MAQLDPPVLPLYLYRYRPLRDEILAREIGAIREQYLWLSKYRALNDPMEGFYQASRRVRADENYTQVAQGLLSTKRNIGICSFSETKDNELMWAHYASNYAGMCVAYRAGALLKGLPDDTHLVRLAYGSVPPGISNLEATDLQGAARKILSHKKSSWVYEREWRVLGPTGHLGIGANSCAKEVYLGARITPQHKQSIFESLRDRNIRIYEMRVSNYAHEWSQLKH